MSFSPAFSRLIFRRGLSGTPSLFLHRRMTTAATAPTESVFSSPCMMLPPSLDANILNYNFYSLAKNSVRNVAQKVPYPIPNLTVSGSSHGWLSLFDRDTLDLFLYNPISLRRINLPPIHNLPPHPGCNHYVEKVILSCSPDEDEHNCRAMMIFNAKQPLAFCCPGRSKEWTPIGEYTLIGEDKKGWMSYTDVVYSSRQNLFFGLQGTGEFESWDLSDLSSPRMIKSLPTYDDDGDSSDSDDERDSTPKELSASYKYLVVGDELFSDDEDDVLLVTRFVMEDVKPDGSFHNDLAPFGPRYPDVFPDFGRLDRFPHVTIGFNIDVYDLEKGYVYGVDSLDDRAIFIGSPSDSVALSATRFPELKPNSIYFTDVHPTHDEPDKTYGGHDIGIFNYENKTVSPCYYPCDVPSLKRIFPSPVWFYPSGRI